VSKHVGVPVSFEVGLVADERHRSVVAAEPLVPADDVQEPGGVVEAVPTNDRVDDDESVRPLQIPLRLLVRLPHAPNPLSSHLRLIVRPRLIADIAAFKRKLTRKPCYHKNDRAMRLIKLLPVSILTTQFDNTHMVCCWKVHVYYLVLIARLYGQNKAKTAVSVAVEAKPEVEIWQRPKKSKER